MSLNYNYALPNSDLTQLTTALKDNINRDMNCCKVAKIIEFYPENFTVKCRIMNKKLVGLNNDGTQILQDYPTVFARLHNIGYGNIGITHHIQEGQEGLLLFNDRELETWFLTGETGLLKYDRTHDMTDALFICGFHSVPNVPLIKYIEECLHIYYGDKTDIQLKETNLDVNSNEININAIDDEDETIGTLNVKSNNEINVDATNTYNLQANNINVNGLVSITGNEAVSGTFQANGVSDLTAYTGVFATGDGRIATVVNGIIKSIGNN